MGRWNTFLVFSHTSSGRLLQNQNALPVSPLLAHPDLSLSPPYLDSTSYGIELYYSTYALLIRPGPDRQCNAVCAAVSLNCDT